MAFTQTIPYTTAGNYVFDSSLIEFTGSAAQLKNITPTNSVLHADYASSANLNWSNTGGSLTGTLNGSPTVSGGKLVCTGTQGVSYADTTSAQETFRCIYTPNYTGTPPANINIMGCAKSDLTNNDHVHLFHSSSGATLRVTLSDSSASSVLSATTMGANPSFVASTDYEIELTVDSTNGVVRLFIDGVLHATNSPGAWTRGSTAVQYYVGANADVYNRAEGSFDDYITFTDIQHTTTYTPGAAIAATLYSLTNPSILVNATVNTDGLTAFTETATKAGSDEIKYTITQGGTEKYWNGSAWVTSDGTYAQAATAADINTNASSLSFATGQTVQLKAFLHSDDGSTRPLLDENTLSYDFFVAEEAAITKTPIYIYLDDLQLTDVTSATLTVQAVESFFHGNRLIPKGIVATKTTTTSGYIELAVIETTSVNKKLRFSLTYTDSNSATATIKFKDALVPSDAVNGIALNVLTTVVIG